MRIGDATLYAALLVGATLATCPSTLAAAGGAASGGAGAATASGAAPMGVGPSGPTGNANFVFQSPNNNFQGVGPSGPVGNSYYGAGGNLGYTTTNGNLGTFFSNGQSFVRDGNTLNNGNGNFGFSTQGYGFGLGIGWGGGYPGMLEDEQMKRERERLRARLNTPSVVPVNTRLVHRGGNVIAIKDQMIDGKMVRSEGNIIQEYGTAPSRTRMASRQQTRTFARVIKHNKQGRCHK